MIKSLHPHHHHVIDVTPEEELESCSGGHGAVTGKTSAHKNKVGMAVHDELKHQLGIWYLNLLSQSSAGIMTTRPVGLNQQSIK